MKLVIQYVNFAQVIVDDTLEGQIHRGFVVLAGIEVRDTLETTHQAVAKLLNYRIIPDHQDKLNLSILDIQGELLLVSQFTLLADTSKGLRPNFSKAAKSPQAEYLFNQLVTKIGESGLHVETGQFGAKMQVSLTNSGPVTIILDN